MVADGDKARGRAQTDRRSGPQGRVHRAAARGPWDGHRPFLCPKGVLFHQAPRSGFCIRAEPLGRLIDVRIPIIWAMGQ